MGKVTGTWRELRSSGLVSFAVVMLGQSVSVFGSGLTSFALGVWIYQQTGSVTRFALISFFAFFPNVLAAPFGGALVDRWDRRWALVLADAGAALGTLVLALLFFTGRIQFWHICVVVSVSSMLSAIQFPAFGVLTPEMVSRSQLGRANGLAELGTAVAMLLAPLAGGFLVGMIQVAGVMLIDFATFVLAVTTLVAVGPPRRRRPRERGEPRPILQDAGLGWRYIRSHPGLLGLLAIFAVVNFTFGTVQALLTPLVLSFATSAVLGGVLSAAGCGMVVGGLVMAVWGGPQRRVATILALVLAQGLLLMIGGLRADVLLIAAMAFLYVSLQPVIGACSQTLWQNKVEERILGRVFAIRRMVASSSLPLAFLLAGPLADHVFEPLLAAPEGTVAGGLGLVFGTGPGRGIGLLISIQGVLVTVAGAIGFASRSLRHLEKDPSLVALPRVEGSDVEVNLEMEEVP